MKKEIERKFIVLNKSYKDLGSYDYCIQGYIPSTSEPLIRIRTIGNKSFLTMKSAISGITRLEYEYEIPNLFDIYPEINSCTKNDKKDAIE